MKVTKRSTVRARLLAFAVTLGTLGLVQVVSAAPASAIEVAPGAFVHHHVATGLACPANEVMVGIHLNQGKVICAALNFNYNIASRVSDPSGGTQVSSSPAMHGCPPDFLIQGVTDLGPTEDLSCVSLRNNLGQALTLPKGVHDGRGSSNGTQSTIYGLSPTMHVCGIDLAMRGIHQVQNDLFCAG